MIGNRELALLIWAAVLLILMVVRKELRSSLAGFVKTFLQWGAGGIVALMAAYIAACVYALSRVGLWTLDLAVPTSLWFLGPAFMMLLRVDRAGSDPEFFRRSFLHTVTFSVVFDFLISLYPMNLILEVLFVPVLVILGGMLALSSADQHDRRVSGCVQGLLTMIALALLAYNALQIAQHLHDFFSMRTLRQFLMPILLTAALTPFVYVFTVVTVYQLLFLRVGWRLDDEALARYAKGRALRSARLRLSKLRRLAIAYPDRLATARDMSDVDRILGEIIPR